LDAGNSYIKIHEIHHSYIQGIRTVFKTIYLFRVMRSVKINGSVRISYVSYYSESAKCGYMWCSNWCIFLWHKLPCLFTRLT